MCWSIPTAIRKQRLSITYQHTEFNETVPNCYGDCKFLHLIVEVSIKAFSLQQPPFVEMETDKSGKTMLAGYLIDLMQYLAVRVEYELLLKS